MSNNEMAPECMYLVRFDADWDWHDCYAPSMTVTWKQFECVWDWHQLRNGAYPDGRCVPEDRDVIDSMYEAGHAALQISKFDTEKVALCDVLEAIDGYTSWQEWLQRNEDDLPF